MRPNLVTITVALVLAACGPTERSAERQHNAPNTSERSATTAEAVVRELVASGVRINGDVHYGGFMLDSLRNATFSTDSADVFISVYANVEERQEADAQVLQLAETGVPVWPTARCGIVTVRVVHPDRSPQSVSLQREAAELGSALERAFGPCS